MWQLRRALVLLAAVAGGYAAWRLRPHGLPAADPPDAAIVWACHWLGCAVGGYLGLAVAATALLDVGDAGPTPAALDRWTPAVIRRLVHAALSVGLVSVVAAPAPALAGGHGSGDPLDWPGLSSGPPAASQPARPSHPHPHPRPPYRDRERDVVAVRPGDSLWSITAHRLGPTASPAVIAGAWPDWYAANRAVIGPDPNLIHPGQRLRPPDDERSDSR